MLSKFLRPLVAARPRLIGRVPLVRPLRFSGDYIPPDQYDIPFPNRLKLGYAMRVYWEIIPLVFVTCVSLFCVTVATLWAFAHKVDCVYTSRSMATISRTMDLRNPTAHKMVLINQRYEPWPEMQTVLDKMTLAEKRALVRMQSCSNP